jgi:aldose 1-epimerase
MRTEVEIARNRWAKSAHLLPFPNRVHRGAYAFEGKSCQLPINFRPNGSHAIHGFAMGLPWELAGQKLSSDAAELRLSLDCPDGQEGYPFPWQAELDLKLSETGLRMETRLINRGKRKMPAGWGWHPYFRTGTRIDSLELQLPKARKLKVDEWMIPTGQFEGFSGFGHPTPIGERFLDACLELEAHTGTASCHLLDRPQGLKLTVSQGASTCRHLQVFTHPNRHGIALEPMSCAPDAFNNGMGLQILAPKECLTTLCEVSLSAL